MILPYIRIQVKQILHYKADFLIGILPHFIGQLANLVFFRIITGTVAGIQGWELDELVLIYGFSTLVYGIYYLLFGNFRDLKAYLFNGQFEVMRIRPLNLIAHIMVISFRSEAIEQILLGGGLVVYAAVKLSVPVSLARLAGSAYFAACGVAVLGGLTLLSSSFLFVTHGTFSPIGVLSQLREYTKYPIDIFGGPLQFLFTWILPIGYVSYFPSVLLLGHQANIWLFSGLLSAGLFAAGYFSFTHTLRFYEGVSA